MTNNNNTYTTTTCGTLILILTLRSVLITHSPIQDCDEVFNYWEPLHYLLHNTGMQTWEYSPQFGLRTFTCLYPLYVIGTIVQWFITTGSSKVLQFTILRGLLAGASGYLEYNCHLAMLASPWLSQLTHNPTSSSSSVGYTYLVFTLLSPGMFHASGALLPSAMAMQCVTLSLTLFLQFSPVEDFNSLEKKKKNVTVLERMICIGLVATLAFAWPFCAVLWIPIGIYAMYYHYHARAKIGIQRLLQRTASQAMLIQAVASIIDCYHYRTIWTVPSWNIFWYNAASGSDELYGTEPMLYYVKNLLLNFTPIVIVLSCFTCMLYVPYQYYKSRSNNNLFILLFVSSIAPMLLWLMILVPRPHKEERFMFPIYPLICFTAAIGFEVMIESITTAAAVTTYGGSVMCSKRMMRCVGIVLIAILSLGRIAALCKYYSAPISLYTHLSNNEFESLASSSNDLDVDMVMKNVCVGGDWHRFPSSFFLPESQAQLAYVPSEFKGQLPQPFSSGGVADDPIQPFNDENREEPARYIAGGIDSCDYVIELVLQSSNASSAVIDQMHQSDKIWEIIYQADFLDSVATSAFHRVIYLPYISKVEMGKYVLYRKAT